MNFTELRMLGNTKLFQRTIGMHSGEQRYSFTSSPLFYTEVRNQIRDPAAVTPEEEYRVLHGCAPEPAWKLRKNNLLLLPETETEFPTPTELTWLKRLGAIFMSNEVCVGLSFFLLVILRRCNSDHITSNCRLILDAIQRN